ncbi:hypothetical protein scyTo_0010721 [Scyliorhinus torazame]|uniref:Protein NPAT C-terminal domain-containing protein n=1 Tax=Scyliorhinus torazame TaxID=75743 RepID=A0A401PAQ4_SCYTO|nr:hypothetical protein [Scyliorhinus torazame]
MLLPSDIARLVLGYLQQEKLSNTCRAFILESGDLKEYAEHSTEDGLVPACLLSLFGKNLKTILNEYVIMKARDSMPEAPAVLPSLWRKLEYTLLQIRSLQQSSVALATNQRARTKNALSELRRRGSYSSRQVARANSSLLSISPQIEQRIIKPLSANPIVITHSTGTSPVIPQPRPDVFANQICSQDPSRPAASGDVLHIVVPGHCDRRLQPEHISPGKRKCDSPRKRGNFVLGQNSTSRSVENEVEESQVEIAVENFPQRVIENAREKILKDRSLLEKLAENINKVMFSETNTGHPSKPPDTSTSLPEQSIDEILGLGDEVHMSDEAIQDILEQTESDPAFQALFDLFDYGKSKRSEDGVRAQCSQELEIIENSASSALSDVYNTYQTEEMLSLTSTVSEKVSSGYKKKSKADGTVHKNKMSSESNSTKSTKRENRSFPTFSTTDTNKPTLSMDSQMTSSQASRCSCWTTGEASSVSDLPSSVTTIHTTLAMSGCQEDGNVAEMEIEAQSSSVYHEKAKLSPLVRQELSEDRLGIEELTSHNGKAQSLSKLACQTGLAAEANKPSTVFTMGQPVSSSFSQGSTFIITSPVQPVLQGMMGVIPVSIMGPNNGTSFTVSPQQILRMPVPTSLGKKCNRLSKLPISRKPPQLAVQPSTLNTGQSSVIGTFISIDSSISQSNSRPPRGENSDRNIPLDQSGKSREHPVEILNASSSKLKSQRHRRVLCFDNATAIGPDQPKVESNTSQEKKENRTDNINQSDKRFSSQNKERSERTDTRVSKGREIQGKLEKNKNVSSGPSYDSFHKTTANKENEASRDQVRPRGKETSDLSNIQIQKKGSHSERPNSQTTIGDKDGINKIPESQQECKKGATSLAVSQETTSKRNPDKNDCFSLTSTLTKQAAEMLQDMQRQSPVPKQTSNADLAVPRTPGSNAHEGPDDSSDFQRTPRNKGIVDDKASPRVMVPPTTPDIPTCSPASEAGSENSVSMAAHTLMILSRAAIARTTGTTPLKDNTCQIRSPLSQTKKRKLEEREEEHRQQSLSSRLDLQNSSSPGKKKRSKSHKHKRKKHLDSFPVEMDVDKFLSSLQYDE